LNYNDILKATSIGISLVQNCYTTFHSTFKWLPDIPSCASAKRESVVSRNYCKI